MDRLNLLICDLDGTLLGDDCALANFASWYATARAHCRLVYSSGRFIDSVIASMSSSRLPEPDAIIGGVGTQIYDCSSAKLVALWPPAASDWNPYVVQSVGESFQELTLQPAQFISCYKISYYGYGLSEPFMERLRWQLSLAGQRTSIVYSSNRDLDILPEGSGKSAAANYLAQHWTIATDRTFVAGNSGNDADMFRAGFRGIVVRNATPELSSLVSPTIYHATETHGAGVLEGIRYWQSEQFIS